MDLMTVEIVKGDLSVDSLNCTGELTLEFTAKNNTLYPVFISFVTVDLIDQVNFGSLKKAVYKEVEPESGLDIELTESLPINEPGLIQDNLGIRLTLFVHGQFGVDMVEVEKPGCISLCIETVKH